jgi:hypothetical protein
MFADGQLPKPPIGLVEVQGYLYAAYLAFARMLRVFDGARSNTRQQLEQRAEQLKAHFNEDFWMPEQKTTTRSGSIATTSVSMPLRPTRATHSVATRQLTHRRWPAQVRIRHGRLHGADRPVRSRAALPVLAASRIVQRHPPNQLWRACRVPARKFTAGLGSRRGAVHADPAPGAAPARWRPRAGGGSTMATRAAAPCSPPLPACGQCRCRRPVHTARSVGWPSERERRTNDGRRRRQGGC